MEDLQDKQVEEKIKTLAVLSSYLFPGRELQLTMAIRHSHSLLLVFPDARGQIVDGFIRYLFW